jgi:hypothetical protein
MLKALMIVAGLLLALSACAPPYGYSEYSYPGYGYVPPAYNGYVYYGPGYPPTSQHGTVQP